MKKEELFYQMEESEKISEKLVDLVFNSHITENGKLSIYGVEFDMFSSGSSYITELLNRGYTVNELNIYEDILGNTLDKTNLGMAI